MKKVTGSIEGDADHDIVSSSMRLQELLDRLSTKVEDFRPHFERHRSGRSRPSMTSAYRWSIVGGLQMKILLEDIEAQLRTHDFLIRTIIQ